MKELFLDLCAKYPHLRDRHGIGERTSREAREVLLAHSRVLAEQVIPDRPLHPDDMPPKGGSLVLGDDYDDPPNADIFDEEE